MGATTATASTHSIPVPAAAVTQDQRLLTYARQVNIIVQNLVMVIYSDLLHIAQKAVGARPNANNAGFDVISSSGEVLVDGHCMSALQRMVHHARLFFDHYAEIEPLSSSLPNDLSGSGSGYGSGARASIEATMSLRMGGGGVDPYGGGGRGEGGGLDYSDSGEL